jgi:hypothetical protein
VRTQKNQWRSHPELGGDLESLFGRPNTRENGIYGANLINKALLYSNRFDVSDIKIKPVPVRVDQIDYFIFLDVGKDQQLYIRQSLNL